MSKEQKYPFATFKKDKDTEGQSSYLDEVKKTQGTQEYKDKSYEFLEVTQSSNVLDIGCGDGDDVINIAKLYHPEKITGVDFHEQTIETARNKIMELNLPVHFQQGDARTLEFDNNTFHSSREDRLLQHLENPLQVIQEITRVTKPGGKIVSSNPSWGTMQINSIQKDTTNKFIKYITELIVNGNIGSFLPQYFDQAGIKEIKAEPLNLFMNEYNNANCVLDIENQSGIMVDNEIIKETERDSWIDELKELNFKKQLFCALYGVTVHGRKE